MSTGRDEKLLIWASVPENQLGPLPDTGKGRTESERNELGQVTDRSRKRREGKCKKLHNGERKKVSYIHLTKDFFIKHI